MKKSLEGNIALVTGGSRGIGRSICVELAASGAYVLINYASSPDAAEETLRVCHSVGGKGEVVQFDVSNSEEVNKAFDVIKEKNGTVDILVNNAGISKDGLFIRLKDEDWYKTLSINLNGVFFCSRAAAKLMIKAKKGRIVNISSVVGEMGNSGQVPYVSSKAGIIGITKAMARELAIRNITVNAVAPGFIESDMTESLSDELKEEHKKSIPLGRFGKPEEIAKIVQFLASDNASYITGQVIGVNGGMYM
jgi:3-oxoacyl-[acyl-carrier protein] reductase